VSEVLPPTPIIFPEKMQCIFLKKRYIVLYGGRGAGRSWGVARSLLVRARAEQLTVLCARELQKSIDESVHKTLKSQIELLGLSESFEVQRDKIYGPLGSEFSFIGIKSDPNKVRSFEGIDICWVEEANKVTKDSWNILTPTIRKKGSQIFITFNPELEEDYTYKNFVTDLLPKAQPVICQDSSSSLFGQILWHETDDTVICKMDYEDNPWFWEDTELPSDMLKVKNDPEKEDEYLNVWKGFPKRNLEGAIYAKELRKAERENRICAVPYEREIPVDTYWDLGKADFTCIWFAQRVGMQWRILDFIGARGQELSFFIRELQRKEYIYGTHFLPWDADHAVLGRPHTIATQLRNSFSPKAIRVVAKHKRTDGINAVREMFPQCWFDGVKCRDGISGLRRYKFAVVNGVFSKEPSHDGSDPADAFRTMAMARRLPRIESDSDLVRKRLSAHVPSDSDALSSNHGWLGQ